jgi:mRNA interferase MazF
MVDGVDMNTETVRVIANVPKEIAEQADQIARTRKLSRSKLITECLRQMIEQRKNELMAEGYDAMAEKHREFAKLAENGYKDVVPTRGDIYWVDWFAGRGSEQTGTRPALVIQNDIGNQRSPNVIVASITAAPNKPYPFMVLFSSKESGLLKNGAVDLASIMTVSKERLGDKCGQFTSSKMKDVDNAICSSLGIEISRLEI